MYLKYFNLVTKISRKKITNTTGGYIMGLISFHLLEANSWNDLVVHEELMIN